MAYLGSTTTRPAGIGGIDISGMDLAAVIFEATGGGYGAPVSTQPAATGAPKSLDWFTNWGNGPLSDSFDFSKPPADRDAEIKLVAEPEGSHPLLDLFQDDTPTFANGGPEGTACVEVIAAVAIVAAILWAVDDLSGGAVCGILGWEHKGYADPDATTGSLTSPADMLAGLLGSGILSDIDLSAPAITDLVGKMLDRVSQVTDLAGALDGFGKITDAAGLAEVAAGLMKDAGIDGFDLSTDAFMDAVFTAAGIAGGSDGAAPQEAAAEDLPMLIEAHWLLTSDHWIV